MQKTFSFEVGEDLRKELIEHYQDVKRDKTPPYAIFQANEADTVVTLYESGKLVLQGANSDIDANYWVERETALSGKAPIQKEKKEKKEPTDNTDYYFISSIGSDEVGTGDFFGPVVVTASYVDKKDIRFLEDLGVRDSKKVNDEKIIKIAPEIIKKIPYVTTILSNTEYNKNYSTDINMNKIKALLHNKALRELLSKDNYNYDMIVMDQFAKPFVYFNYLKEMNNVVRNIKFTTHAEDKCLSVAVSSIISRYIFLKEMKKLSEELNMTLPKGASTLVDEVGKQIVSKYGKDKLNNIAKLNFKNKEKILN